MNLNSISETLLRRRTASSTQQQQNNVDTNNNGVGNTFGVNFSTSTLASALLISSMNQPSSTRPKKTTNNNVVHKENVGEDNKTSSRRHRQKDDNTSTAKNNNMPPPPPPPPPPGPPPVRRSRNKKINSSLVDDTTKKPSSSINSSGNSKSISPTLLQRRQMNPLSPVNNNSPMNRNQRGEVGGKALVKEQKSVNVSASYCTSHRSKAKSPIVAMNSLSQGERRRPIVSTTTTNSTRLPKRKTQNNLATEATRGITTPPNKKLVSPQSKRETSDHQVAIKSSHTTTTSYTTKSLSPAMQKIVAKYGSDDSGVNHKLLTSPNISDRKQHQHDTIAKQQQANTTTSTLDTNRYANKALQLKRSRQQSIQTNVINTKRKEANKKADIVKQFRQQKHRGRCTSSRAMKNDSTTSTTAAKETSNDCSRVQRQRSLSVPRKTTKSLEDGLDDIDIQMDNLAVTQSCSFFTTHTTDTNVDDDETNKRRLQMRRKRAREVLARRIKKI